MEAESDVYGLVVDVVLKGTMLQGVEGLVHLPAVGFGDFGGVESQLLATLEVDEQVWTGGVVEFQFVALVIGVEEDDFVFVVAQVAQGIEQGLLVGIMDEGIGEYHYQRAPVEAFGCQVQCRWQRWIVLVGGWMLFAQSLGCNGLQQGVEQSEQVLLVHTVGAAGGVGQRYRHRLGLGVGMVRGKEREPEGVALSVQQFDEHGGGIDAEGEFVGVL